MRSLLTCIALVAVGCGDGDSDAATVGLTGTIGPERGALTALGAGLDLR